jgi:hypothetical protein
MKIQGIGKDVADVYIQGDLARLEHSLAYFEQPGYTVAEVPIPGLNVVVNGRLLPQRVQAVKAVLSRFSFRYTVHAPGRTNLAYGFHHEIERFSLTRAVCRHLYNRRSSLKILILN